jgi:hypothetical protein
MVSTGKDMGQRGSPGFFTIKRLLSNIEKKKLYHFVCLINVVQTHIPLSQTEQDSKRNLHITKKKYEHVTVWKNQ